MGPRREVSKQCVGKNEPFADRFVVLGWPYRANNGVRVLTKFPNISCVFFVFPRSFHHF